MKLNSGWAMVVLSGATLALGIGGSLVTQFERKIESERALLQRLSSLEDKADREGRDRKLADERDRARLIVLLRWATKASRKLGIDPPEDPANYLDQVDPLAAPVEKPSSQTIARGLTRPGC